MSGNKNVNKNQPNSSQQKVEQIQTSGNAQVQSKPNDGAGAQVQIGTVEVNTPEVKVPSSEITEVQKPQVLVENKEPAISPFEQVLSLAKENAGDKLHAKNMIDITNKLLAITVDGATAEDYEECAQYLISLGRSLNIVSDKVFIAAFPVILDQIELAKGKDNVMFTHPIKAYKILTHCQSRGLEVGHRDFITVMNHLAPKESRKAEAKKIDVARNFSILTDEKRTRFIEIFR